MNCKKILAGILSAAMVFTTMAIPAFADDITWEDGKTVKVGTVQYATLKDALKAVYMSNPTDTVIIDCKFGADVGGMTHAHVADNLIINGNNAYVSSGERDMEFDTYKFSRQTGEGANDGDYLTKEVTVKVNKLNGIAAWGQRNTNNTINLEFTDCKRMHRVYISGTTGTNNIKLTDCTFDGTTDSNAKPAEKSAPTSVYSNAPGKIELSNCVFNNIALGVNINNKSTGAQDISISGCKFTDCATTANSNADWLNFAAPIRLVTSGEGATIDTKITDTTITGTNVGNGDILLGDGRKGQKSSMNVTLNISGTAAKVIIQEQGTEDENGKITPAKEINVTADDTDKVIEMITWDYGTDSGIYTLDGTNYLGVMRFMFGTTDINANDVTKIGIKYISSSFGTPTDGEQATGEICNATDGANKNAVQGDIINIPTDNTNTYYAAAFIEVGGKTYWSAPISCTLNTSKELVGYTPQGGNE